MVLLLVGLAGSLGASLRYVVDRFISTKTNAQFPLGTFVINATGSLLLGIIEGMALRHHLSNTYATILGTGFCGAFTTFSTYMYETFNLFVSKSYLQATLNLLGTTVICLCFAGLGLYVVS